MTTCSTLIDLVQGDTKPRIIVQLDDKCTLEPIDLTGATVVMRFREIGAGETKDTLDGILLTGWENEDGLLVTDAPYDVEGVGGRVGFDWNAEIQTVIPVVRFRVREQFA